MLDAIITVLLAISTTAFVVLLYHAIRTDRPGRDDDTSETRHRQPADHSGLPPGRTALDRIYRPSPGIRRPTIQSRIRGRLTSFRNHFTA